jgi:adenosine kinase
MDIVVTGSIAFDYLMSFPGSFSEHLLPEHLSKVSLSFLVESMDKRRGGCAPNIAYSLALLGERPRLMATAGEDFEQYRQWLESAGVDTSLVGVVPGKFTASFFCSTDRDGNQIASFYTGAMAHAGELSFRHAAKCDLAIVSPNDPGAMIQYAAECRALGIGYIFDPGQQVARLDGERLREGITGAYILISNEYESEIIRQKTALSEADLLSLCGAVVVTRGESGASILTGKGTIPIPAVAPDRILDPTGVGDAFRSGFMKGLAMNAPLEVCGRMGSVAAAYVLENVGGQSHAYTWAEFAQRYERNFGRLEVSPGMSPSTDV